MQPRLRIKTLEYASQSEKSKDLQYDLDGPPWSSPQPYFSYLISLFLTALFEFSSHCEHFFLRTHYSCFSLGAFTLTLHSAPPNSYDLLPHFPTLHSRRFNLLFYLEDGVLLNHPLPPFYIFFSEFDKEIKFKVFQVETGRIKILL